MQSVSSATFIGKGQAFEVRRRMHPDYDNSDNTVMIEDEQEQEELCHTTPTQHANSSQTPASLSPPPASQVFIDCALDSSQTRNLEHLLQVPVLDRFGVILAIFSRRARTRESKLQVELARIYHTKSRLRRSNRGIGKGGGDGGGDNSGDDSSTSMSRGQRRKKKKKGGGRKGRTSSGEMESLSGGGVSVVSAKQRGSRYTDSITSYGTSTEYYTTFESVFFVCTALVYDCGV